MFLGTTTWPTYLWLGGGVLGWPGVFGGPLSWQEDDAANVHRKGERSRGEDDEGHHCKHVAYQPANAVQGETLARRQVTPAHPDGG